MGAEVGYAHIVTSLPKLSQLIVRAFAGAWKQVIRYAQSAICNNVHFRDMCL